MILRDPVDSGKFDLREDLVRQSIDLFGYMLPKSAPCCLYLAPPIVWLKQTPIVAEIQVPHQHLSVFQ